MKTSKGKHERPPLGLVGEEIGNARKTLRLTTLQVSEKTRIPERYVIAVEAGDFASLPGKPFIFGFTRTICALLGLDADDYIATIKSELFGNRTGEPSTPEPARARNQDTAARPAPEFTIPAVITPALPTDREAIPNHSIALGFCIA